MGALPKIPAPLPQPTPEESPKRERPKLRIVPGGPETIRQEPEPMPQETERESAEPRAEPRAESEVNLRVVVAFFLCCVGAVTGLLIYTSTPGETLPAQFAGFNRLHDTFASRGIDAFLEEKKALRDQIEKTLASPSSPADVRAATNLAALLFPELLSDDDFEKSDALAGWSRLEKAIEQSPRTTESRLWFEELRATLWNYENADRANPRLTPWGKEVLRIYDVMTAP